MEPTPAAVRGREGLTLRAPFGPRPARAKGVADLAWAARLGGRPPIVRPQAPKAAAINPLPWLLKLVEAPSVKALLRVPPAGRPCAALPTLGAASALAASLKPTPAKTQLAVVAGLGHVLPTSGGRPARPSELVGHRRTPRLLLIRLAVPAIRSKPLAAALLYTLADATPAAARPRPAPRPAGPPTMGELLAATIGAPTPPRVQPLGPRPCGIAVVPKPRLKETAPLPTAGATRRLRPARAGDLLRSLGHLFSD